MRRKLALVVLLRATLLLAVHYVGKALATPSSGFKATTLAWGRFGEIDVFNRLIPHDQDSDVWLSLQKTKGSSDLYVQSNVWGRVEVPAGTHTLDTV